MTYNLANSAMRRLGSYLALTAAADDLSALGRSAVSEEAHERATREQRELLHALAMEKAMGIHDALAAEKAWEELLVRGDGPEFRRAYQRRMSDEMDAQALAADRDAEAASAAEEPQESAPTRSDELRELVLRSEAAVLTEDTLTERERSWSDQEWMTQVQAARLRVKTDKRLGKKTPEIVRRVAELPDRKPRTE